MAVKIYDSLSKKLKKLIKKNLKLFVCGPTVYDYSHLGHLRTYLVFDGFVKFLRYLKYNIYFLVNITDIDDKIINKAKEEKTQPFKIARKFEKIFKEELKKIKINSINKFARASQYLPQIFKQIKILIKKNYAYITPDGSVYFRTKKFKNYGKLSNQDINQLKDIEKNEFKEDPLDFALWKGRNKKINQYEPLWKSPWGYGRPGWHIEDTAITEKYFGVQYDLHGGGKDLIFPHHECEIAQQEAASGKKPFVKIWMHTGLLYLNGQKMSKSLKNFVTLDEFSKKYPLRFFRFLILNYHWQSDIDLNEKNLKDLWNKYFKINEFISRVMKVRNKNRINKKLDIIRLKANILRSLKNNFNLPLSLSFLLEFINKNENNIDNLNKNELITTLKNLDQFYQFLFPWQKIKKNILMMIKKREILRKNKKFELADKIREKLKKSFIYLEDQKERTLIVNLN